MKLPCTLSHADGHWRARHASPTLGTVELSGPTREQVLTRMREELQYRIELCPCSGVSGDTVVLQVSEAPAGTG